MKINILLLFLALTFTVNAQVLKLDILESKQEQTEWCWVAASQSLLAYYGCWLKQCEIAEFARQNHTINNYGVTPCCDSALLGCNQGNSLGGPGSISDILLKLGNIKNWVNDGSPSWDGILHNLRLQRPFIIRREIIEYPMIGHALVIYGMDEPFVRYLEPNTGFDSDLLTALVNDGEWRWTHTVFPQISPLPDHCYNCKLDADKGEEEIDCGGVCPPCVHAPDKLIINTPTSNLPSDVRAVGEITAGNAAVKVLSGQNVTFTTAGTINLMPGFEVGAGANFDTQLKTNSYDVSAVCGRYCGTEYYPTFLVKYEDYFRVHNLVNASTIAFEIYTSTTLQFITNGFVNVTKEGTVNLWDLIGSGNSDIWLFADIYLRTCYGTNKYYLVRFCVINSGKSLNEEFEEPQNSSFATSFENPTPLPPKFSPVLILYPNPNSGVFQLETNFPLSDITHLKVTNLLGGPVYETKSLTSNSIQLPASASGYHFVVIILKDGTVLTQKMMVRR